jgi:hypothetical protein
MGLTLADTQRGDYQGFGFTDATGRSTSGQLGPWTLSGDNTNPLNFRTALILLRSSGTITTATITLQGSIDNVNWFPLQATRIDTGVAAATLNYAGGGPIPISPTIVNYPLKYIRVDVSSLTGGGTVFADVNLSGD